MIGKRFRRFGRFLRTSRHVRGTWKSTAFPLLGQLLESRLALSVAAIEELTPLAINTDTGDKPQSKVWEHAGAW